MHIAHLSRTVAFAGALAAAAAVSPAAYAGSSALPAFSVRIPFTHSVECPGTDCSGSGSAAPYGSTTAVLTGDGFDVSTWMLTLSVSDGSTLVLDVQPDFSDCTTPGGSGEIPRPPTSRDFGNPVTCAVSYTVEGGTGDFANAAGTLQGSLSFAGTVLTLSGS